MSVDFQQTIWHYISQVNFFLIRLVGGGVQLGPLSLPWVIMMMENLVEWRLAGETEELGENPPSATLSTTDPTWPDRGGKPGTNRLSYGAANISHVSLRILMFNRGLCYKYHWSSKDNFWGVACRFIWELAYLPHM
jgi:hypothetical protein